MPCQHLLSFLFWMFWCFLRSSSSSTFSLLFPKPCSIHCFFGLQYLYVACVLNAHAYHAWLLHIKASGFMHAQSQSQNHCSIRLAPIMPLNAKCLSVNFSNVTTSTDGQSPDLCFSTISDLQWLASINSIKFLLPTWTSAEFYVNLRVLMHCYTCKSLQKTVGRATE